MSILLVGYRGCGKTTVGKRLADRLWQDFIDIDDRIVKKAGKNIRDIFETEGEARFRDLETEALKEVCALQDVVVSLGGGTVLREENRALIKSSGHKVIYLKCTPEELHKRIAADPQTALTRPALTNLGGNLAEVESLLAIREPLYREVKTAELDVTHLTPQDAVVYIVRLL